LRTEESLIRIHAAWAIGHIGGKDAVAALECALRLEEDLDAIDEINLAIKEAKANLL